MTNLPLENVHYPIVKKWATKHFGCFRVDVMRGLIHSRIDVLGIRDVVGGLSGEVESIAIEVKRGPTYFANAAGQAFGYKVYANRVYLAVARPKTFTPEEILIASNLGIGLIWIKGRQCKEILTSPVYQPIQSLQLKLFESLQLGKCQACGSFFDLGKGQNKVQDQSMTRAVQNGKGLIFVLKEIEYRKIDAGVNKERNEYHNYRYICPNCVSSLFAPLVEKR